MHAEKICGGADMTPEEYIAAMHDGLYLEKGTELTACMRPMAREAQKITAEINGAYHTPEEQRALMAELTGKPVDEGFALFPPIYTDCGRNLTIGKNVFINSGCCFQDQGGVTIGDGCLIGHQVVFATLDHMLDPSDRAQARKKYGVAAQMYRGRKSAGSVPPGRGEDVPHQFHKIAARPEAELRSAAERRALSRPHNCVTAYDNILKIV